VNSKQVPAIASRKVHRQRPCNASSSASDLAIIAGALDKPITYFFPEWALLKVQPEKLSAEQQELLIQAQRLGKDDLQRLIAQARALADLADQQYEQEIAEKVEQLREENPDLTSEEIAARILEFRADRNGEE
jgi:hypothetical protein